MSNIRAFAWHAVLGRSDQVSNDGRQLSAHISLWQQGGVPFIRCDDTYSTHIAGQVHALVWHDHVLCATGILWQASDIPSEDQQPTFVVDEDMCIRAVYISAYGTAAWDCARFLPCNEILFIDMR